MIRNRHRGGTGFRPHISVAELVGLLCALVLGVSAWTAASAHEVRPAYLELREEQPGEFSVLFKTPMRGDARLALAAQFSGRVEALTPTVAHPTGAAMVETWRVRAVEPLAGQTVTIEGLTSTMTDALVRIEFAGGNVWLERLSPRRPEAAIPLAQSISAVAAAYVRQGIEHILAGLDHLLFVVSLMMIVRDWRVLVKTITAFTVAHSITLTLATFGWVTLPARPVEVMVALSILLVAAEVVRMQRGQSSLTITRPWQVAFAFGLLHGFGFADALVDLGLPRGDLPLALLSFNVGVEIGQLMVIGGLLLIATATQRVFTLPRGAIVVPAYAIGVIAAFWSLGRVTALFA